jgi:hypothetical protein
LGVGARKMKKVTRHEALDVLYYKGQDWSELKNMDNYELLDLYNMQIENKISEFSDMEPNRKGAF